MHSCLHVLYHKIIKRMSSSKKVRGLNLGTRVQIKEGRVDSLETSFNESIAICIHQIQLGVDDPCEKFEPTKQLLEKAKNTIKVICQNTQTLACNIVCSNNVLLLVMLISYEF